MTALESVITLIKEWKPAALPTEAKYRDDLTEFLRPRLKRANVQIEYRHLGTTTDIYVKQEGVFLGSTEVFVELKRNLTQKSNLDRLIGQIECLKPKKNFVIVVLCGTTSPALVSRFKEQYGLTDGMLWSNPTLILKVTE